MSATVMPRRKAATLMRPRSSGVMSIVRRAVNASPATLLVDGVPAALIQLSGLPGREAKPRLRVRSEEHTSELQSLMRISYAVFCLKKKTQKIRNIKTSQNQQQSVHAES